jgi:outer membrane receptor protein involved in Fe transport
MKRFFNLIIAATLAMGFHVSAFAQTVEEVTVTATRQAESLQDIALSVQAITGEDLMEQHIETAADLANSTTGISFANGIGSGVGIKIRGLIVPSVGAATVAAADLQLNGHSISASAWSEVGFLDAERLEILEGPQGTLYGRNTTSGLMNLISNRPGAGNYFKASVGDKGYQMIKGAYDFDIANNVSARVAFSKYDKDPTVFNEGTMNKIDNRDAYGYRLSVDWAVNENNTIEFNYDQYAVNDNRLNLGTSSCNRSQFFGCTPNTNDPESNINRPVFISGTISNTFDTLTFISTGRDTLSESDVIRSKSIDQINKTYDAARQQEQKATQIKWLTSADVGPGTLDISFKATNTSTDYYQRDDNDHNNAEKNGDAAKIGNFLQPSSLMTITNMPTTCYADKQYQQFAGSEECSNADAETNAFEINVASDFDNHNFVVGLYSDKSNAINQYNIQTTAYQLINSFSYHPLSQDLFGGQLDAYGGQAFYASMAGVLAANAVSLLTAKAQDGGVIGDRTRAVADGLVNTIIGACTALNGKKEHDQGAFCDKKMPHQAGGLITDQRTHIDSRAVFGEYYFTFMDNFKLTLGARYMDDRFATRSMQGLSDSAYNIPEDAASGLTNVSSDACRKSDYEACWQAGHKLATAKNYADTYKGVLQYSYDQGMAYVSMTTGNRAGGANPDTTIYAGSKAVSYEIGTKNILLDGRLKLNANIFKHEQNDSHYSVIRVSSAYVEPHDIVHQGLQLDTQFFITEDLVIAANVLLTDSEFVTSTEGIGKGPGGTTVSIGSTSIDPHNPDQATSWSDIITAAAVPGVSTQQDNTDAAIIAYLQTADALGGQKTLAQAQGIVSRAAGTLSALDPGGSRAFCNLIYTSAMCNVAGFVVTSEGNVLGNPQGLAAMMGPTGQVYKELGGNSVPGVSDMEATVSISQLYNAFDGSGNFTLGYSYKDKFEGDIFNNKRFITGAQEYFDFNATYEPNNGDWYVNAWARNLADKRQLTSVNRTSNLQGQVIFLTYSEGFRGGVDFGINF